MMLFCFSRVVKIENGSRGIKESKTKFVRPGCAQIAAKTLSSAHLFGPPCV